MSIFRKCQNWSPCFFRCRNFSLSLSFSSFQLCRASKQAHSAQGFFSISLCLSFFLLPSTYLASLPLFLLQFLSSLFYKDKLNVISFSFEKALEAARSTYMVLLLLLLLPCSSIACAIAETSQVLLAFLFVLKSVLVSFNLLHRRQHFHTCILAIHWQLCVQCFLL